MKRGGISDEGSGLDDLTVGLCRNEHGILIDDQHRRAAAELAEGPVECLACFFCVILVILRVYDKVTAVPEQQTAEVDPQSAVDLQLAKVDEHLFTGCGIKDVVVDPLVLRDFGNNAVVLEIVDVVAQRLRDCEKKSVKVNKRGLL